MDLRLFDIKFAGQQLNDRFVSLSPLRRSADGYLHVAVMLPADRILTASRGYKNRNNVS